MNKKAIKVSKSSAKRYGLPFIALAILALAALACDMQYIPPDGGSSGSSGGAPVNADEVGRVVNVIDGDTIDVDINGSVERIRYVGVNTPERDEPCYAEAKRANEAMVSGQTVSLVRDVSETDRYDRLLRFVYVGSTFVNAELVRSGWAEAVVYEPDDAHHDEFVSLESAPSTKNSPS